MIGKFFARLSMRCVLSGIRYRVNRHEDCLHSHKNCLDDHDEIINGLNRDVADLVRESCEQKARIEAMQGVLRGLHTGLLVMPVQFGVPDKPGRGDAPGNVVPFKPRGHGGGKGAA